MEDLKFARKNVLIIEDDLDLAELISQELTIGGFTTFITENGEEAFSILRSQAVALVLLDLMLPGEDGLEICKRIQQLEQPPRIIMVTARNELADKVAGLELGADDYVVKPFEPRELLARCKAVIRRAVLFESVVQDANDSAKGTKKPRYYQFLGWQLDLTARQLYSPDNVAVSLPNSDFHVLLALIEAPNEVMSRGYLLKRAFSRSMNYEDRAVDVCISRLRQYLEKNRAKPELIRTLRNEGYVLHLEPDAITVC